MNVFSSSCSWKDVKWILLFCPQLVGWLSGWWNLSLRSIANYKRKIGESFLIIDPQCRTKVLWRSLNLWHLYHGNVFATSPQVSKRILQMHELNTANESFGVGEEALAVSLLLQTYRDIKEKTVITFRREFSRNIPNRTHSSSKFLFVIVIILAGVDLPPGPRRPIKAFFIDRV